ncbi:MAG: hypothetical protein AB4041_15780 [Microcystaceae cyanobacterium]
MKKLPPFLLGISLLFWGWQTDISVWGLGLPMAILVESSYWLERRWDVPDRTFQSLAKITLIITIALYFLSLFQSLTFIYTLIQLLPILLFPLFITQIYSSRDEINIYLLLSFFKVPKSTRSPLTINLEIPYLFMIILAASAGNQQSPWFYGGMFLIIGTFFWKIRSQRHSLLIWLLLLSMAGLLGLWSSSQLYQLQGYVEQSTEQWFENFFQPNDPLKTNTRIGDLGSLKQSNEIRFRVKINPLNQELFKVRQATYNRYQSPIWVAKGSQFREIKPLNGSRDWPIALSNQNADPLSLTIYDFFPEKKGLLKQPNGAYNISNKFITKLKKSQYGSVRVNSQNKWLSYDVSFQPSQNFDALPDETDLEVPISEKKP